MLSLPDLSVLEFMRVEPSAFVIRGIGGGRWQRLPGSCRPGGRFLPSAGGGGEVSGRGDHQSGRRRHLKWPGRPTG